MDRIDPTKHVSINDSELLEPTQNHQASEALVLAACMAAMDAAELYCSEPQWLGFQRRVHYPNMEL